MIVTHEDGALWTAIHEWKQGQGYFISNGVVCKGIIEDFQYIYESSRVVGRVTLAVRPARIP